MTGDTGENQAVSGSGYRAGTRPIPRVGECDVVEARVEVAPPPILNQSEVFSPHPRFAPPSPGRERGRVRVPPPLSAGRGAG